jgi:hypothetical protein
LREVLNRAVAKSGYGMGELTVLAIQNDPYRVDTPAGHHDAAWFEEQIDRFVPTAKIHLRGLHYQVSLAADVILSNGKPYTNTDEDWTWLQSKAAKAARWLGYVGFERIVDQRNEPPKIYIPESVSSEPSWEPGDGVWVPHSAEDAMPRPTCKFQARQPYRIIMIGEKASLDSILLPVVQKLGGELLLPTGDISETMVADMASRVAVDGRPTVVFYFLDFDPSGWQMAVSVSRKLQALRDHLYPELVIDLYFHRRNLPSAQDRRFAGTSSWRSLAVSPRKLRFSADGPFQCRPSRSTTMNHAEIRKIERQGQRKAKRERKRAKRLVKRTRAPSSC